MEHMENTVTLRGSLAEMPRFSHENHGKRFFKLYLQVPRLSGAVDTLPVILEESVLNHADLTAGELFTVTGQIRSHNIRTGGRRHLLIFLFGTALVCEDGEPLNHVCLEGILCKEPTFRRTPLGREICDAMLAVPRPFHRSDYLPCILWGSTARDIASCHTGDRLQVTGRLQSRNYTKITEEGIQERTAYEVSALSAQVLL